MTQAQTNNPLLNWDHSSESPTTLDDLTLNLANAAQKDCAVEIDGPIVWVRLRDENGDINNHMLVPEEYQAKSKKLIGNTPKGIRSWDLEEAVSAVLMTIASVISES